MANRTPASALSTFGFSFAETGGGCSAYERVADGVEIVVTHRHNGQAPEHMSDPVEIGVYAEDSGKPALMMWFPTVTALVKVLVTADWPRKEA